MQEKGIGGKSFHVREYTEHELYTLFQNAQFRDITISTLWLGVRGRINIGVEQNIIPFLNHSLFLLAYK